MSIYGYFVRGAKHAAMCATSIQSVAKVDHAATFHVMSDDGTRLPSVPGARIHEHDFDSRGAPIMIANLEAQVQILGRYAQLGDRVTFLDTDILMLQPLPFTLAEDLLVTWRDHVKKDEEGNPIEGIAITMPYNYGVIGARAGLPAIESFLWMRERIRRMNPNLQRWYGNQVALAALCGPRPEEGARLDVRGVPWQPTANGSAVSIMKLPGERWNYTPAQVGERIHGTRSVLHFKGHARGLMESYARKLGLTWHIAEQAAA